MRAAETYKLVEKPSSDFYSVQITSGPFSDTIYTYGTVSFKGRSMGKTSDVPILSFRFKIEQSPLPVKLLETLPEFKNLIGDILHDILEIRYLHDGQSDSPINDHIKPVS